MQHKVVVRVVSVVVIALMLLSGVFLVSPAGHAYWSRGKQEEPPTYTVLRFTVNTESRKGLVAEAVISYSGQKRCASIAYIAAVQRVGKSFTEEELRAYLKAAPRRLQEMINGELMFNLQSVLCKGTSTKINFTSLLPMIF